MNKTTLFGMLTVAAFVSTASLALAEEPQQKAQPQQQGQQQRPMPTVAQEQFDAKIVAIDKEKGTVSVETTQHGQLEFKLTPAQLQRLKEGDSLRLQIHLQSTPK